MKKKNNNIKKKKHILAENLKRFLGASGAGYFGPAKINESRDDVQAIYDKVYQFTDSMGDDALEIMDKIVGRERASAELEKFVYDEEDLSSAEERKLIAALEVAYAKLKGSSRPTGGADTADTAYGKIYQYTDTMGDEALEIMDEMLDDAGLFDLHQKHMDEEPLSADEEKQLIDIYTEIAGELKHGG